MITKKVLNRQSSYGSTKINMLLVLMSTLLTTSLCQNVQPIETSIQPIEISLQYGHNSYSQLSRYFGSSQQFTISDMKSEVDLKSYHFCYIQTSTYSQVQIADTLSISSNESPQLSTQSKDNINTKLNNNKNTNHKDNNQRYKDNKNTNYKDNNQRYKDNNQRYKDGNIDGSQQRQQEKIVYDLDDIISTGNVLATQFYHTQRQTQITFKYTQSSQSVGLLLIVMPNKYITLKLQQERITQPQIYSIKQKKYKLTSKLSTSFTQNVTIAKFININNKQDTKINNDQGTKINNDQGTKINNDQNTKINNDQGTKINNDQGTKINNDQNTKINNDQGTKINNDQGTKINNDQDKTSKEEYVLMTDRELFKVQIDKNKIKQQNYYGSIYINGKLNTIQKHTIIRNLQQQQQLNIQQHQQQLNNQTQYNAVNQQQEQQEQKTEFQIQQQQEQNKQRVQQIQHFSQGVSISDKEILLYSNKNIYLYDFITGKLNRISQQSLNINNKRYTQLIGSKNIELKVIEYTNIKKNKDKVNNNNNNDNVNKQQHISLVLIVADKGSDIKLRYYNNQTQLLNSFSQQTNQELQQSITTTKQSKDYTQQQQSLLQQQLYSLSNTHKCRHVHSYHNQYIFLECKNHLIYYSLQQMIDCKSNSSINNNSFQFNNKTLQFNNKTQTCINSIKAKYLNLGYHIQSIYLNEQTNYLIITGIDKYQIFHIDYNSQLHQINSIKPINTYYFTTQNIKQVFMINYNYSLVLTKTNLFIVKQYPQTKQIYCKTIDQHSHKGLSQPTGIFNGNITVEGICQDNLINTNNKKQYQTVQKVQNSTYCRYNVPITVNITYVVKTYEFLWYILLGVGIFLTIIGVLYCLIKRQKLNQIYKTLEEENQHGQQVAQHTVITENNESQQQALPIDVPK